MSTYPRMTHNDNGSWYCHDCRKIVVLFDDDAHMCREGLSNAMDFDHCVTVHDDGTVTDAVGVWAPTLMDEELDSNKWEFFTTGYSSQYGYSGPIMHNSEFIGGRLADDILSTPGTYVSVVAYWTGEDETDDDENDEPIVEGWAIVRLSDDN